MKIYRILVFVYLVHHSLVFSSDMVYARIYSLFSTQEPVLDVEDYYTQCAWHAGYLFLISQGVDIQYSDVVDQLEVNGAGGAKLGDLLRFLNVNGSKAKAFQLDDFDELPSLLPGILVIDTGFTRPNLYHSVFVTYSEGDNTFLVFDPQVSAKAKKISYNSLEESFMGIVITCN